jgi:hypothetical protein
MQMCCQIKEKEKAQPAPFFPEGWLFTFDVTHDFLKNKENEDGCMILAPNGRRVSSLAEGAFIALCISPHVAHSLFNFSLLQVPYCRERYESEPESDRSSNAYSYQCKSYAWSKDE